ncbi:MAG: mechanosensitive ion channel family protein [Methanosarcinales archaeon]|nr:mechanosensitive ion channel family protein [Methanosarcinales archaeon]
MEADKTYIIVRRVLLATVYLAGFLMVIIQLSLSYIERVIGVNIWDIVTTFATIIIIILGTFYLAKFLDKTLEKYQPKLTMGDGLQMGVDKTYHTMIRRLLVAVVYIMGILMVILQIPPLQRVAVAMLAGAGLATVAIGFAAQDSLSNIVSGIFLAVFKPIQIGDYVDFNGEYGHIEDITLRHTVICTWDLRRIIVPNSVMGKENIVNWSIKDPEVVWPVNFGISYDADIDQARNIIIEEANKHPMVLKDKEIRVRLTELGDFAVNLRLIFHVAHRDDAFTTGCDIRESVKKRFDAEGIEIPFPYHNIILKGSAGGDNALPGDHRSGGLKDASVFMPGSSGEQEDREDEDDVTNGTE